jgi:hypothetical protein
MAWHVGYAARRSLAQGALILDLTQREQHKELNLLGAVHVHNLEPLGVTAITIVGPEPVTIVGN